MEQGFLFSVLTGVEFHIPHKIRVTLILYVFVWYLVVYNLICLLCKFQDFLIYNIVYTHNLSLSYKDKLWDIQC
nr:MAG TPA: hypothetical protein [Caudoviricetes sp.]